MTTASRSVGSISPTRRGSDPWPRSRRIALEPWRTRYAAPVAPGRSVYAGPAPATKSSSDPLLIPGSYAGAVRSRLSDARPRHVPDQRGALGAWPVAVAGGGLGRGLAATLVIARGRCRRGRPDSRRRVRRWDRLGGRMRLLRRVGRRRGGMGRVRTLVDARLGVRSAALISVRR